MNDFGPAAAGRMARRVGRSVTGLAATLVFASSAGHGQTPATSYHVVRHIPVGGDGGWDYLVVDPNARRLYVSRATHVVVLDLDRDSVVGDIPNTPGVHGIAIAREFGRGFTSNGRDSSVTIFDPATLAILGVVKVTGGNPDAILYEPITKRVFTFNGASASATALDAASGKVIGTIALDGKPEFATADSAGRIFVNIEDKSEVQAIDARGLAVQATWPLAPCEEPSGMAIDRAHHRLFSGCSNQLMTVTDATTGRVVATVPIGAGVDANAFDPATQLAFSSNGAGTLTVVHEDTPDRYTVQGNVPTARGARTMALDERTHRIYTVTAQFGPPPAPTPEHPRPRPSIVPGSFVVLVLER